MTSLTETGMPCSGPRRRPARSSSSRAAASARASPASTWTNAVSGSLGAALAVHPHQRRGAVAPALADRAEDLEVLFDRRDDPVRRREVVYPDHPDALVDVVDVALGGPVPRRPGDALVERLVGVHEVRA